MGIENTLDYVPQLIQYLAWTMHQQALGQPVDLLRQQAVQQMLGELLEYSLQPPLG